MFKSIFIILLGLILGLIFAKNYKGFELTEDEVIIYDPYTRKPLKDCHLYYNTTHGYIDCPGVNLCFPHDSRTLRIIKKYNAT